MIINAQNDPQYWGTQLKLLENPALARQVILTLDLQNNPAFLGGSAQASIFTSLRRIFSTEKKASATSPTTGTALPIVSEIEVKDLQLTTEQLSKLEPYEDAIRENLEVEPMMGTNLVNVRFRHTDPELAQKVANTMTDIFVRNNLERETSGSEKASDLLAKQIADLQLKIKQQEEMRLNYALNHNLPLADAPDSDLEGKRLATLSSQLLEAENERKNLQSLYEAAAKEDDVNAIPEVLDNKRIQRLREKLDDLEQKRSELLVTYTPEWWEVKKIDGQIKRLEEALAKAPREVISSLRSKYEAALARERSLQQAYNQQIGVTSTQSQAQIQLSALKQELETNKQYFNTLLQRQRELQITSHDRPNNVSVANYSRLPREPVGPPRLRNVIVALLLSLGAGIGLAFLLDYLDDTLKSVEDVDRYLHLPALALVPASRSERPRLKGIGGLAADHSSEATALALIDDARSPIAESYRHLRTSLLLSSAGQPPKTILVTSSQPSEGKTTTAVNTAVMLAQTGVEVLIVDCDLRRPRVHHHFGVANLRGITNYLSGESDLDALLQSYEKLPNLKFLTSGPVPPNPAELLGSDEMRKLLEQIGERFTHIIIDSPPAISFTDASILSTLVDGVVLVVHGGRSSRAVVRRAKQQLLDVGAHIFGIVLNNVKLESQDYYYYAGYYSSYYSYSDADDETPEDGLVQNKS
ncbi:MAG TPA: polysaccharide biosynthesis tyrosine autokinase [Pyrinomonadaceae bacterium]|nr:polysaccharide biosynthesis tyrosine autokinase [Pyrinomonadaceae bacterium]